MDKTSGLISIAKKAGFVIIGQDNLLDYDKKLYLILLDEDAGANLSKEANFKAKKSKIPLYRLKNLAKISNISNCKILGIKNKGLADEIAKNLTENN